jgi:DNA-directed RNA polymerase subunit RPC12/RpoP
MKRDGEMNFKIYECYKCGHKEAFKISVAKFKDGIDCPKCHGPLIPSGEVTPPGQKI